MTSRAKRTAVCAACALVLAGATLAGLVHRARVRYERVRVELDLERVAGGGNPAACAAAAGRLDRAAQKPGLGAAERFRRLRGAGTLYRYAGRRAEARAALAAAYDSAAEAGAAPVEVVGLLDHWNKVVYNWPDGLPEPPPPSPDDLAQLRLNTGRVAEQQARFGPEDWIHPAVAAAFGGDSALAVAVAARAAALAETGGDPAEVNSLTAEATRLALGDAGVSYADLATVADLLARAGHPERAGAVAERLAAVPESAERVAGMEALVRFVCRGKAGAAKRDALRAWLAAHPKSAAAGEAERALGLACLDLGEFPEAATALAAAVKREDALPWRDADRFSADLAALRLALGRSGRAAEAEAVRRRLATEFAGTPAGRDAAGP